MTKDITIHLSIQNFDRILKKNVQGTLVEQVRSGSMRHNQKVGCLIKAKSAA